MSSFDAAFLHGVADYSKGTSPTPEIPDWKNLQRRSSDVENTAKSEWQNNDSIASDIKDIASDFDFDSSLEDFVIRANDKIDHLHQGIRDASYDLNTNWDPDGMTREQMVNFVENLKDQLQEYLPNSHQMRGWLWGGMVTTLPVLLRSITHWAKHGSATPTTTYTWVTFTILSLET